MAMTAGDYYAYLSGGVITNATGSIVVGEWYSYMSHGLVSGDGSGEMTFDQAAIATVRKPIGRVTVHWGGAKLDNLEVTWPSTTANWIHSQVPELQGHVADGITTVSHKWFRCDGVATLNDMVLAPGDAAAAALYQFGWWGGTFSDGAGVFSSTQYLRLRLVEQAVATVSVTGDSALGEYPVDFTVMVFSGPGGAVLEDSVEITANAQVSRDVSVGPVSEATAIVLAITKWSAANAVVKMAELFSSAVEVYDGDEIMSINVLEENEIKDATLPAGNISANELELQLNNVDDKFFPANDDAPYHAMVRKGRKIEVELGFNIPGVGETYVDMGTFWSGDWKVSEKGTTASTTAYDRMGRLQKITYSGSTVQLSETIGTLAAQVLDAAMLEHGMGDLTYSIDDALYGSEYTVPVAWFDRMSYFDALKQLAGACLGRVYVDRDDVIQFKAPAAVGIHEYELTADDYYERTQPEEAESVENRIEVCTQPLRIVPPEGGAPATEVYRSSEAITMAADEQRTFTIVYSDKPVYDATASAEATDGSSFVGSIVSASTDYYAWGAEVVVQCTTGGEMEIVIDGDLYAIQGKEVVVQEDSDSQFQYGLQRYELKENPLVQTRALADLIAATLLETYKDPARDVELNWRGNPNIGLETVVRAPEYVRGAVSNKSDFEVYKQKLQFDGTLRSMLSGRRVREVTVLEMQDTDDSGYDLQDTDDSGLLSLQDSDS